MIFTSNKFVKFKKKIVNIHGPVPLVLYDVVKSDTHLIHLTL